MNGRPDQPRPVFSYKTAVSRLTPNLALIAAASFCGVYKAKDTAKSRIRLQKKKTPRSRGVFMVRSGFDGLVVFERDTFFDRAFGLKIVQHIERFLDVNVLGEAFMPTVAFFLERGVVFHRCHFVWQ